MTPRTPAQRSVEHRNTTAGEGTGGTTAAALRRRHSASSRAQTFPCRFSLYIFAKALRRRASARSPQ